MEYIIGAIVVGLLIFGAMKMFKKKAKPNKKSSGGGSYSPDDNNDNRDIDPQVK